MKRVASLPGKIMLAGEYAVLFGGRALSSTIDKRLAVTATALPTGDAGGGAKLASAIWPAEVSLPPVGEKPARELQDEPFAQAAARAMEIFGLADVHFEVQSDLKIEHGVGTSSAIRAGVLVAANAIAPEDKRLAPPELAREAWRLQRAAQSMACALENEANRIRPGINTRFMSSSPSSVEKSAVRLADYRKPLPFRACNASAITHSLRHTTALLMSIKNPRGKC